MSHNKRPIQVIVANPVEQHHPIKRTCRMCGKHLSFTIEGYADAVVSAISLNAELVTSCADCIVSVSEKLGEKQVKKNWRMVRRK